MKINIKIVFFGIFKEIFGPELCICFDKIITINDLKIHIEENLLKNNLIYLKETLNKSVFSNNNEILNINYHIKNQDIIYLLPPFSGG